MLYKIYINKRWRVRIRKANPLLWPAIAWLLFILLVILADANRLAINIDLHTPLKLGDYIAFS